MDLYVFGNTKVMLTQQFVEKMPIHINKMKFFEESVSSSNCIVSYESANHIYSLEGCWDEIVRVQDILITALQKWSHAKQIKEHVENSSEILSPQISDNGSPNECESLTEQSTVQPSAIELCKETVAKEQSSEGDAEGELNCPQSSETSARLEQLQCELLSGVIPNPKIKQPCLSMVSVGAQKTENTGTIREHDFQKFEAMDTANVDEMCTDIQLEHNYNHFEPLENIEPGCETAESAIENEIYMDIKLSNPTNKIFSDPDMPVTLVVAKEDEPGVEVVQLNVNKSNSDGVAQGVGKARLVPRTQEQVRLQRKKYEENSPYKYFCSQCSFKTKRQSHMRKHTRLHEKVCTIYTCEQCDFSTIRASHLQRHIGTHKTEVFACSECTFSTHSEALLTKHQRYKHILKKIEEPKIKNTFQCLHCDYSSASQKMIERHLSVHSQQRQLKRLSFKCSKCAYQTPSRANYFRHLLIHGDQRPFMCSTCGLCFKRSDTLAQHQVVHSEMEQAQAAFPCPQCKKFCRSASSLKDHLLTHGQDRRFLCEICAASFKTRAVQRKHYNEKHVHEKVHSCPSCSKNFTSKYLLKRHMKVHASTANRAEENESQETTTVGNEWCDALVATETPPEDVQMIVVHQEPSESEVFVQEGPLFQIASSLVPGQTLSVPIIPVEYVVPVDSETDYGNSGVDVSNSALHISSREEEIIALTFVPDDSA